MWEFVNWNLKTWNLGIENLAVFETRVGVSTALRLAIARLLHSVNNEGNKPYPLGGKPCWLTRILNFITTFQEHSKNPCIESNTHTHNMTYSEGEDARRLYLVIPVRIVWDFMHIHVWFNDTMTVAYGLISGYWMYVTLSIGHMWPRNGRFADW